MKRWLRAGVIASALVLSLGVLPSGAPTVSAQTTMATAPAKCDWIGTATGQPTDLGGGQLLLRLKVDQDLGNPEAVHGDMDTVQVNYSYDSSFLSRYNIKEGTGLHISGYVRQGNQCVVDTLNVGTLEPGREGYIAPTGVCLQPGAETIGVAEKASNPLGCAVSPALKLNTPTQAFQNGNMFYSRGIYVLQFGEAGLPTAAPGLASAIRSRRILA